MKLKLIAAAAALALSGAANAQIDTGATGNGDMFFSIWDGQSSYTLDLQAINANATIDGFESAVAGGSFSWAFAADPLFLTFLSTANLSALSWNISAADSAAQRRLIETYTTLPGTTFTSTIGRGAVGTTQAFIQAVNATGGLNGTTNSAIIPVGTNGYAGAALAYGTNVGGQLNFNNSGTAANGSYADGLNLMKVVANASGTAAASFLPYAVNGVSVRAWLDTTVGSATYGQLMIAAVPEPETYAMLLAGLGLMGAIARRRRQQG